MESEKIEQMQDWLFARINKNYTEYLDSLDNFSKTEIINMAGRIKAVSDAHSYMTTWHDYDAHELAYLLEFQNPLEVFADEWYERCIDQSDMSFAMEEIYERSEFLLDQYPLIHDADVPIDTSLRRFMGVDLEVFLGKIAEKTIVHYPNDWKYDAQELRKIAQAGNSEDKRLIWHVCSMGTHLKNERDVYIRDTGAYEFMTDYHQNDPDMFGYYVEVLGVDSSGSVVGNVFEVGNYAEFAEHIRNVAETLESLTLIYSDSWGVNAGKAVTVSRREYDDDRHRLMSQSGNVTKVVYHPKDKVRLAGLIVAERARRMSRPMGSMSTHFQKIHEILKEVRKPPEKSKSKDRVPLDEQIRIGREKMKAQNNAQEAAQANTKSRKRNERS
ncbi:MAG: hypothetical protein FWH04_00745 [Oscillospiraceae bacterium]|nr:hypothetical protein [Oscillospiraceae bacterium]